MADSFVRVAIQADDQSAAAISQAQARIQAFKVATDSSGASLMEARGAAKLFGEEVGVNLNRHLASVLAKSSTLGPLLSAAFPVAAAIGFAEVIASGAEKMSNWVAKTYIFTDAMKELDKTMVSVNQTIEKNAEKTAQLAKAYELIGLSGSAKTGVEATQKQAEITALQARERDLRNNMYSARNGAPGSPSTESTTYTKWAADLGEVQSKLKLLNQEALNLNKSYLVEWEKEGAAGAEKLAAAMKKLADVQAKAWFQAVKAEPTSMDAGLGINDLPIYGRGIQNPLGAGGENANISAQQGWFEATRTAAEKYEATVAQLNRDFANNTSSETYQRALQQIKDQYNQSAKYAQQFVQAVGDTLKQGILMGRSWSDVMKSLIVDIIQMIAKMTILKDLQSSMGGGGVGGFFSNVLGGIFGGGKAVGGSVSAGTAYLVGENGPELFMPSTSGSIVPNGAVGGQVVYDFRGAVVTEDLVRKAELRAAMQTTHDAAVRNSLASQREISLRR